MRPDFHIAAIGGSAGSLEAIEQFFKADPPLDGLAYIVIVHHSPEPDSLLASLLPHWTSLPVTRASDGTPLEIGHVYVCDPGHSLTVVDGILHSTLPTERQNAIDGLLCSLARDAGSKAAAIILSGYGNDGTAGATALHEAGGKILVQALDSCHAAAMPRSIIEAGLADQQIAPSQMPQALREWLAGSTFPGQTLEEAENTAFSDILDLVRQHTNNNMHSYKPATLRRRVERRVGLNHAASISEYLTILQHTPAELDRLAKDMLIGVTAFFRDADAFRLIEKEIIPAICAKKPPTELVRVWLAGCSTGEEAYSVAILLHEWFAAHDQPPRVQIFATDIDEAALDEARSGLYSSIALQGLTDERLHRFFVETKDGYRIAKPVRETIIFASHNLISDPPFSRLDLIVCRNVLIYLNADTQKRLLNLFHFVLNQDAYLFLGSSESIGTISQFFHPISKQWRIYRHVAGKDSKRPTQLPLAATSKVRYLSGGGGVGTEHGAHVSQERNYRELIDKSGPTLALVNQHFQLLYTAGETVSYLEFPMGEPTQDLFRIARPELRVALRSVTSRAMRKRTKSVVNVISGENGQEGMTSGIRIAATPIAMNDEESLLLLTFEQEHDIKTTLPLSSMGGEDWLFRQMELELNATREDLQRTVERLRASNEEFKGSNEEIMAMNEELQSANEELESSKEELQSLNEELATSNTALDLKVQELETSNNDLNNLLLSTDMATIFLDDGLRIRRFTSPCTHLMRVIPADIGRSIGDIVQRTDDQSLIDDCQLVLSGGTLNDREIRNADGRWYLRRILPYRGKDNVIKGIVLTYPDITSVKQSEAELALRNEQLEWRNDLLREATVTARDMNDRIIFWNPGTEALYGWSAEEAIGKCSHELLNSKFELTLEQIRQILLTENIWSGRITHIRRNGKPVIVDSRWSLRRDAKGKPIAIVEINNDVTERVAAESQLDRYRNQLEELVEKRTAELKAAQQQAEDANHAKSVFLANMSHEIRTPLNAIIGMSHLIRRSDISPEQAERITQIDRSGQHLLEVINAILDLSKIEAGKFLLDENPLNVNGVIGNVVSMLSERAGASGLKLVTDITPLPSNLLGDSTRFQQALLNYTINAIKFTESGTITLRSRMLEETEDNVLVRMEVQDTGVGIAPEKLGKMFSAFEQADNSTTRNYGGTGLGLAITRKLAKLMGGEAGCISTPSVGSTFWFTARLRKGEALSAKAIPQENAETVLARRFSNSRILVVEDEPINRDVIMGLLDDVGLHPDVAEDGQAAVELAGRKQYDLVLMDMQMPRMDGLQSTRQIRALPQGGGMPILAMTANAFVEDKNQCLEAGMNDFLTKPVDVDILFETILKWLERNKKGS